MAIGNHFLNHFTPFQFLNCTAGPFLDAIVLLLIFLPVFKFSLPFFTFSFAKLAATIILRDRKSLSAGQVQNLAPPSRDQRQNEVVEKNLCVF